MPPSSISVRRSIRWLPGLASEPTDTLVLTGGQTGVFLDVRFKKNSMDLDWAFAGYRKQVSDDVVEFKHHIDSRTLDPLLVQDKGRNTVLESGETAEVGEMVNPETEQMTAYEEIWEELASKSTSIFVTNDSGTKWQAQVDDWQLGMGRDDNGRFWAWQATRELPDHKDEFPGPPGWKIIHCTDNFTPTEMLFIFDKQSKWKSNAQFDWKHETWKVLEIKY